MTSPSSPDPASTEPSKAPPPRRPLRPLPPDDPIYSSGAWVLFPSAPQARPSGEQHQVEEDADDADLADLSGS